MNDEWADGVTLAKGQGFVVLEQADLRGPMIGFGVPRGLQDGDVGGGRSDVLFDGGFGCAGQDR